MPRIKIKDISPTTTMSHKQMRDAVGGGILRYVNLTGEAQSPLSYRRLTGEVQGGLLGSRRLTGESQGLFLMGTGLGGRTDSLLTIGGKR